jgi:hypothetical protein
LAWPRTWWPAGTESYFLPASQLAEMQARAAGEAAAAAAAVATSNGLVNEGSAATLSELSSPASTVSTTTGHGTPVVKAVQVERLPSSHTIAATSAVVMDQNSPATLDGGRPRKDSTGTSAAPE